MVKVNGIRQPANFIVAWDDGEGPACLTAGKYMYGQGEQRESEVRVVGPAAECCGVAAVCGCHLRCVTSSNGTHQSITLVDL